LDREERRALLLNSASSLLRIPHEALQANLLEWIQASREQPPAPNRPARASAVRSWVYWSSSGSGALSGLSPPAAGR
ncbi:hypothetical protein QM304_33135, partial [Pseudomonas aeruginosa]|nr:hypothetical protein [Pseudomonas aeruginosa]